MIQQEEPQEDEAIPEEELCTCCGERRRDTSFGEDYPYCTECREVMKASGLRVPAVLMLLLTFVLAGASLYFSTFYIADYSTLMEAEMHYEARELSDAAALYSNYISQKSGADLQTVTGFQDAYSVTAVKQLAKTFSDMGYLGDANEVLTTYLGEKALKRPWNKAYLAMTEEYIKSHLDAIKIHESDIESRLIENDFSIDGLIAENQRMITSFQDAGEQVVLIGSDYEQSITEILTSVEN